MSSFLIGQRVIADGGIGYVVWPDQDGSYRDPLTGLKCFVSVPGPFDVWVHLPHRGYARMFAAGNVKPLPGGQL